MEKVIEKVIKVLVEKSETTVKSEDAMRFSQAAQNLANLKCSLLNAKIQEKLHLEK